ncbi:4-hydroxy-3-methylbut-2-enyl diphosphate reductase [Aliikangiella coralliicola]|uniref:4-hydroxy-3-methylbut-2-enyl diphosphate reductase n=1 Tax=Aliikangiella coralliicola TaxID=2592383 RepID=A0A545UBA0_9GAMM|nr:4-hydroxy-3-methylbut-2-enyl diphosphate reductase [Aliikangiella coralliicola]TQV86744.1 4-hydroxy-3-methylbut-2-enyl diphosphate reductase [Aliikangiella coralliicola]
MKILLANPRGFCAGVDRAIEIVNRALDLFGAPIYVKHEVVHNKFVVDDLKEKGAIFIEDLSDVPPESTLIYSAHGVSQAVKDEAKQRGFRVFDATCPLVTKVHMEVVRKSKNGEDGVLIGHKGHPEVEGTMGQYANSSGGMYLVEDSADIESLDVSNPDKLFYVSQTTLSVDETKGLIAQLKQKFPEIKGPKKDDICYATQNRQDAVKQLAEEAELILVVGSQNSSNSNRLKELAEHQGSKAYLIDNAAEIQDEWLSGIQCVGVTAGASAPEILVEEVIEKLKQQGGKMAEFVSENPENMYFPVPIELR